mmetsp:Transcript_25935/g.65395  ORF Transcript_25935/g.65395 Transcript_25935/m.65395 type:complete len:124 (+) Transcript_25935:82-453(+)|eukprot:g12571.t1
MAKFASYFPRSKAVVACCCAGGMVFARLNSPPPPTSPIALPDMVTIDNEGESDSASEENAGAEPSALLELGSSDDRDQWLETLTRVACEAMHWSTGMFNCEGYAIILKTTTVLPRHGFLWRMK